MWMWCSTLATKYAIMEAHENALATSIGSLRMENAVHHVSFGTDLVDGLVVFSTAQISIYNATVDQSEYIAC